MYNTESKHHPGPLQVPVKAYFFIHYLLKPRLPKFLTSLLIYIHCFFAITTAQEYNYRHYDRQHGLAGSTVYNMYQDTEGFLWFTTETGVSRFDGTHFKKFTVKDGLPDNAIVRIFGDSRGRIWLVPFTNSICYYYQGKIYNQQNDPLLKKIVLDDYVCTITENNKGDLLIQDPSHIYRLFPNDSLERLTLPPGFKKKSLVKVAANDSGDYFVLHTYKLYKTNTKIFTYLTEINTINGGADNIIITDKVLCWLEASDRLHVRSATYHIDYTCTIPPVNTLYCINDSIICLNTTRGTLFFNLLRGRVEKTYLPHKNVSRFLRDRDGGLWFATFNSGIYYLSSSLFKHIQYEVAKGQYLGIYDLEKGPGGIWAASDIGYIQVLREDSIQILSLAKQFKKAIRGPVYCMDRRGDLLVMGVDADIYLHKSLVPSQFIQGLNTTKDIAFKNEQELIVAGSSSLYTMRLDNYITKKLWIGRTTCLLYRNDSIYFGAYDGLYLLKPDKTVLYFGAINPLFKNRISAIREGWDGTIWMATYNRGIIGLKDNKVIYHITQENGLSSDACRCLAMDGHCLWAGTDNGLNKIIVDAGRVSIDNYFSDGLASDLINTVLVDGNTVYAGTPQGITCFNKTNVLPTSRCDFKMLGITVNGKETGMKENIRLSYGYNSLHLDYVAISFASAGNIVYTYRLRDLDTSWKTTTQTTLEFIALPPGEHVLEIYGTNKFRVSSNRYQLMISVQRPFWQAGWFILACMAAIISITWLVVSYRNRQARKKEAARYALEQQLQGLEQKALRSQMNPHFIFNCMNSIQEFIVDKDVASANKYLSKFASLIRQTLDNSLQSSISLADEIKYLTTYLNLEQMRFKNMFSYHIHITPDIQPGLISIPVMLLQPYIENAIRHGMQEETNVDGEIEIGFSMNRSALCCTITDNGIGREAAGISKRNNHAQYQSRGMQLTAERIALMNNHPEISITVDIKDLKDETGQAAGTAVTIRIPITPNLLLTL